MNFESLRTWAEVDLDAIAHNFQAARDHLPKHMKLLVTVKANAYGHGAVMVAKCLEGKADYLALAAMDEAVQLRQAGIRTPLLILGPVMPADYRRAAKHKITLAVSNPVEAKTISDCAAACGGRITVHFALDTGSPALDFPAPKKLPARSKRQQSSPASMPRASSATLPWQTARIRPTLTSRRTNSTGCWK